MDAVSASGNAGNLTRLIVGAATQQSSDMAMKMVKVNAQTATDEAKRQGIGVVLDMVA